MGIATLVPLDEYLRTSYSPDKEYRRGVLVERSVGNKAHARLQGRLAGYLVNREEQWAIEVFTELRIQARADWYPIPDICVYPAPAPDEEVPSRMPLLWIEILSPDDRMVDVWEKAREVIGCGSACVWIIDPKTLESELWTEAGSTRILDQTLRLPASNIVIPLPEVTGKK